jgi:hypothetical protein
MNKLQELLKAYEAFKWKRVKRVRAGKLEVSRKKVPTKSARPGYKWNAKSGKFVKMSQSEKLSRYKGARKAKRKGAQSKRKRKISMRRRKSLIK